MKVLYLDFDGVLHDEVYVHRKNGIYIKAPGRTLFEWMPTRCDVQLELNSHWGTPGFGITQMLATCGTLLAAN